MGQDVVILDPFRVVTNEPDSLNPLERLTSDPDTVADEAFMLASLVSEGVRSTRDAFWDDLGECLLTGLFTHVATTEGLPSRALGDVWNQLASDDFQFDCDRTAARLPHRRPVCGQVRRQPAISVSGVARLRNDTEAPGCRPERSTNPSRESGGIRLI